LIDRKRERDEGKDRRKEKKQWKESKREIDIWRDREKIKETGIVWIRERVCVCVSERERKREGWRKKERKHKTFLRERIK
jgi:hypothetical protein